MNKPLTREQKERFRSEYLADPQVTYRSLAAKYGVSESAMQRALAPVMRPQGGPVRASLTTATMQRMYYTEGLTLSEIARQAGITESGVSRRLSRGTEPVTRRVATQTGRT